MENNLFLLEIKNVKVKELLTILKDNPDYKLKFHPKNKNLINVYSYRKKKNVIGDLGVRSVNASFRLQNKSNGKWQSFKVMGFDIEEEDFIRKILRYINE